MSALPKRIAVLMGGPGSERNVSLATARGVAKALRSRGAEVFEIDVRDENFELPQKIDIAFLKSSRFWKIAVCPTPAMA